MADISSNYSEADYASNAWTLSGEYGKRFALGGAYIEPNAELILGHIGSTDYTTSQGMKVNVDASKHAITRLGFNLGKEFANANAYFKANYYHDFAGGGSITADTVSYERDSFKNWYELGVGGATKLGKNTSAYAEVNKYFGDMKSDVNFNVGLRYSF